MKIVMRTSPPAAGMRRWIVAASVLALLAPAEALAGAPASGTPDAGDAALPAAERPVRRAAASRVVESPLRRRVALLSAELGLDASQQIRVEALLQRQREQMRELWGDVSVPASVRIVRTQAISDRTAEAIREVLDAQQRRRYIQPRQRDASVGAGGAGIESWLGPEGPR